MILSYITNKTNLHSYSRYCALAGNKWRGPSLRLNARQHSSENIAAVTSRGRQCVRFHWPENRTRNLPRRYRYVQAQRYNRPSQNSTVNNLQSTLQAAYDQKQHTQRSCDVFARVNSGYTPK